MAWSLAVLLVLAALGNAAAQQLDIRFPLMAQHVAAGDVLPIIYKVYYRPTSPTTRLNIFCVGSETATASVNFAVRRNADIRVDRPLGPPSDDDAVEHRIDWLVPTTLYSGTYNVVFEQFGWKLSTLYPLHRNLTIAILVTGGVTPPPVPVAVTGSIAIAAPTSGADFKRGERIQLSYTITPPVSGGLRLTAMSIRLEGTTSRTSKSNAVLDVNPFLTPKTAHSYYVALPAKAKSGAYKVVFYQTWGSGTFVQSSVSIRVR